MRVQEITEYIEQHADVIGAIVNGSKKQKHS